MMKITFSQRVMMLLFSSILIISLFSQSLIAYAAAATDIPPELTAMKEELLKKLPTDSLLLCKEGLVPLYDIEIMSFMKWMDAHFKNASSTSSLMNTAITRYAEFKKELKSIFAKVSPVYSGENIQTYDDQFSSYSKCSAITDSYLELAKERLKQHIKANVAQKKTTMMLEKYQNINSKLRELNVKVAEMYSLFLTFKNKLPFFQQSSCL